MLQHIYFHSEDRRLLGAYHQPDKALSERPLGIIMLHGWAGYRIGAHQMFTKLGRLAEQKGFHCLRFDFRGRGDSEGDAADTTLSTMIADTAAAVDWLAERTGLERIALVGDCSGAEVAIGASNLRSQIAALVLWSAPTVGADRSDVDRAKKLHTFKQYLHKLFRRETWGKLFAGRLRFGIIHRALLRGGKGAGEEGAAQDDLIDWVPRFLGFPGNILFIYGGNDPTADNCITYYRTLSAEAGREFNCHVVAGSNHAFYSVSWEEEVMGVTLDWLTGEARSAEAHPHAATQT